MGENFADVNKNYFALNYSDQILSPSFICAIC
jgi:hypothetical protein